MLELLERKPEHVSYLKLMCFFNFPSYALFKDRIQRTVHGCGADRDRTDDPRLAKPVLSQLSYSPGRFDCVGLGGLEPPTLRLSGVRSNHLSYRP